MIDLKGITWDHERGYNPLIGTTKAFIKDNPNISIKWSKRTLSEFGNYPVEKLAKEYDLLLIDHPFTGEAAKKKLYLDLSNYIEKEHLEMVSKNSIGGTYESYVYNGQILALPVDAAALVSSVRCDLLEECKLQVPKNFDEILELKKHLPKDKGIDVALCPTDIWCVFLSLCAANAGKEFFDEKGGIDKQVGKEQIENIRKLAKLSTHNPYKLNPIQVLNEMAMGKEIVYSPYLFGYVNYSIKGKYKYIVNFFDAPLWKNSKTSTILGGVGIAISSSSKHPQEAAKYIKFITEKSIQEGLYFETDGQPAQKQAWVSEKNNKSCNDFFMNTIKTVETAYIRPRVPGWNRFQDIGSIMLCEEVEKGTEAERIVKQLNELYEKIVIKMEMP